MDKIRNFHWLFSWQEEEKKNQNPETKHHHDLLAAPCGKPGNNSIYWLLKVVMFYTS